MLQNSSVEASTRVWRRILSGISFLAILFLAGTANSIDFVLNNMNNINTTNPNSPAFESTNATGNITLTNSGMLTTSGANSQGILTTTTFGNIIIMNSGVISTTGANSAGIETTTMSGAMNITNTAPVTSLLADGILATATGPGATFVLTNGASILGMTGVGIGNNFTMAQINNNGSIGASTDLAVDASALATGPLTINNMGTITGFMTLGSGVNTMNQSGTWGLRNLAGTMLSVAVANLGTSGSNVINNTGTIELLGAGTAPVTMLNTTGQYLPLGNALNAMTLNGPVQGQILGVQTFNNSGIIDLTANPVPGDVLVISGGQIAGQNGGGVFVANNGGKLLLNTVLNAGGINSLSDVLVVDSTAMGSGPNAITVNNFNGEGAQTINNGILLVEVLNKMASAHGVFVLSNSVQAGAFEYFLRQGGNAAAGGDPFDGNWYLRSTVNVGMLVAPGVPGVLGVVMELPAPPRAGVQVNMAIPPLGLEYGHALLGTYHDRIAYHNASCPRLPQGVDKDGLLMNPVCEERNVWLRLFGDRGHQKSRGDFFRDGPRYDYRLGGVQIGTDIFTRKTPNAIDNVGPYVAYGRISSDVNAPIIGGTLIGTGNVGKVKMNAYSLGAYWTHLAERWYSDLVLQGSYYNTNATARVGEQIKPNTRGALGSLEGGYIFDIYDRTALEPEAQIVYEGITNNRARDRFANFASAHNHSVRGRMGLRLQRDWVLAMTNSHQIASWLTGNVWHEFIRNAKTSVSALNGTGKMNFYSLIGGTWGEIEGGLASRLTQGFSIFVTAEYNHSLDNRGRKFWGGNVGLAYAVA